MRQRTLTGQPLEACLEAERTLQQGHQAVNRVFAHAAGEVNSEIGRARIVFKEAEDLLAADSKQVYDAMTACRAASQGAFSTTSAATEQGQSAARNAMSAMLNKLNRITQAFDEVSKQASGGGKSSQ